MTNSSIFHLLIFLAFVVLGILFYKSILKKKIGIEGFQQQEKFILKENSDIYDDFYGEIYDDLMQPQDRVRHEMEQVFNTIQPSKTHSNMLDVGSGTGVLVNYLKTHGYNAYGVDKSKDMIDISTSRYRNIDIKHANVEEPMAYDRSLFTHIFCMNFTIYEIENKSQFFNNCHYWLQNNGYLIIHLAEKDKFNTIIPGGKPEVLDSIEQLGDKRITTTMIDFVDFSYKSEFNVVKNNEKQMIHKETFTDKMTQNIRQNEKLMKIEPPNEIIELALKSGFIAKSFFTMKDGPSRDKHQMIYILERIA